MLSKKVLTRIVILESSYEEGVDVVATWAIRLLRDNVKRRVGISALRGRRSAVVVAVITRQCRVSILVVPPVAPGNVRRRTARALRRLACALAD